MKKFYLQVQNDGTITDAIEYPHNDYVEVELEYLPVGVYGGWWKLEDGELVEYPELKPEDREIDIERLQLEIEELRQIIDILIGGEGNE